MNPLAANALQLCLLLLALSWAAAAAAAGKVRVGFGMIGVGVLVALLTPILETAGAWPAKLIDELLADGRLAEILAFVASLEALGGLAVLSSSRRIASWIAAVPTPAAAALPPLLAHLSLVHGPRWDLILLASAGWVTALTLLATMLGSIALLRRRNMPLAYETVVIFRCMALVLIAIAIASLEHRPAPTLPFEPWAMLGSLLACATVMAVGWLRRGRLA